MRSKRVIGKYVGQEPGPMLVCLGGIHGNEPAGVRALDLIFKMLEVEPITNPNFVFHGSIVGIMGNLPALLEGQRYLDEDLNRIWTKEIIEYVESTPLEEIASSEKRELKRLMRAIKREIRAINPEKVVFLDLHTTTADGGIFSIVPDNVESTRIAINLHAPVVTGMAAGLQGTTQEFFNNHGMDIDAVGLVFESGQHDDPRSINRAIAALINCMRTIGSVAPDAVENVHDQLLVEFSANLPKVVKLDYCHKIVPQDHFKMIPGFKNFQRIKAGQLLATDNHGPIHAAKDGLILMPLYQKQGEDGFFVVSKA